MSRLLSELCVLVLVAAAMAACVSTSQPSAQAAAASALPAGASAADVIEYANGLRRLDSASLEELHGRLTLRSQNEPSSDTALRLALLLSYPESPHYDLDRAINLLNQIARTRRGEDPAFPSLAELFATILIERRTISADRASLRGQIASRDDTIEELRSSLEQIRETLAEEQRRRQELQGQLDALIELEEQLNGPADGGSDAE